MGGPSLVQTASSDTPRVPMRTCVGCREREPRSLLVRVVLRDGRVVVDPRAAEPGRGAWLHPDGACLGLAVKRRAFARALRAEHADASGLSEDDLRLR
nr:MAG: DUF448 domain-containing protein [Actinomycetota bacterium]